MHSWRFWIISESECRKQTSSYHITATVQQDAPRDVGPSAIGRRTKVCKVLGRNGFYESKGTVEDEDDADRAMREKFLEENADCEEESSVVRAAFQTSSVVTQGVVVGQCEGTEKRTHRTSKAHQKEMQCGIHEGC